MDDLVPVRIVSVDHGSRAAWAEGMHVHLPASVLDRTGWRHALGPTGDLRVPADPVPISEEDVARLREHCAFTDRPPIGARLPFHYHRVPGWARSVAASAIGRWNRRRAGSWAAFPEWPIDLSADVLNDLGDATPTFGGGGLTPVVLTHDIDSAEGLTNLVGQFLPLEEAVGARSTSFVVPCAWPLDHNLIGELRARGHQLGVHGCDHRGLTPFAAPEERQRRLDAARGFAERYGTLGYRAPSLLRTRPLLRDLGSRYQYDSSIPTSGGLFPVPNNGCATARPFLVEGIVELPLTLPRDGSLRFLGYSPDEIVRIWTECADIVSRGRGAVVLLTHCERRFSGNPRMLDAYRRFLAFIAEAGDRFRFVTAASLWRERFEAAAADDR